MGGRWGASGLEASPLWMGEVVGTGKSPDDMGKGHREFHNMK